MPTNYYHQIRRRFFFTIAAVLAVLVGLFVWERAREYRQVISSVEKQSASYASALKEHAERVFSESDATLKEMVEVIQGQGGVPFAQSRHFYELLRNKAKNGPQLMSIYVVDTHGNVVVTSLTYPINAVNVKDRDYFLHHRNNKTSDSYFSKPFKSRVTGTWRFSFSRSLRDANGQFMGLVAISFETGYFEKFYNTIEVGKKGRIVLATTGGDILVHEPFSEKVLLADFKQAVIFKKYLPKAASDTYHVDVSPLDRSARIVSYSSLAGFPVVSIISYDKNEVVAAWMVTLYKYGIIFLLLSVLIVGLSALFLRQLRRLEKKSLQLEAQQQDLAVKGVMIDSALDAILLLDEKGNLLQFNNALCRLTGRSRSELEAMRLQDVVTPDKTDTVIDRIQQILSSGSAVFESEYQHVSGAAVPIEGHARSVEIGQRQLVLSVVRDISTQKLFEETLKKASSEWRDTFDAVEDAVWLLDMEGRIVRANKAQLEIFEKSPQQLIGLSCCDAAHRRFAPNHICPFEQMLATGKRVSILMNTANRWFDVSVDPVVSADGVIINAVHIVKDITALKMSERRERIRAEILERIASNDSLPNLMAFIATAVEKESPGALCSIMLADEEGKRLLSTVAPSLPDFYTRAANRTRIGEGVGACGTAAFRKQRVVVEDFDVDPFWKGFAPAQEAGLRSCWSEPIVSSSDQLLGTFAIYHRHPLVPGDEEIRLIEQAASFVKIALDRSRSEAERAELELQLAQSQKMEAIGHLAGGVAHDFNNLLTPIIVYADLLKRSLSDNEKMLPKIDGIIKASHKARDLTQQLLSFGRKQVMQMQVVDLNEVISSFYSIIRRTLRENIDITLQLSLQTATINADRSKLDQVILNLAINAQDAISETGKIIIETGQVMIDDEYARLHPGMRAGDYILLAFSDDGSGMSDDTLRHIFEPFFTTKQVGHGTGLGLANVYGIVKQHDGYIAAVSKVDSGTTFKIYFPLVNEQPECGSAAIAHVPMDYVGCETILLVEDNEMVRVMTAELLTGFGYKVYAGESPEHALVLVRQIPEKIDLLITDVVMPGMNGLQLFERITSEWPDIGKVLYISGYTNNVIVDAGTLEEGIHFLPKPFTVDALMTKVRGLLSAKL